MSSRSVSVVLPSLLFFGLAFPVCSQPASYSLSDVVGKKQVKFESQAPAEYLEGVADGLTGTVVADFSKPDLALQVAASVPVSRMTTGHDVRDEHMRSEAWLNAAKYPGIRFELNPGSAVVTKKSEGVWTAKANGLFTMKGVTRQVSVPVTIKKIDKGLAVTGRFSVHLEDYGVNGPIGIKMIGLKVSRDVQIVLNLIGAEDPGWGSLSKKKK